MEATRKIRAAQEALRRMRPAKMDAAREALTIRYATMFAGDWRKRGLGKRLLAGLAFEEIYAATRLELEQNGLYESLTCRGKIDRVVATASDCTPDAPRLDSWLRNKEATVPVAQKLPNGYSD